MKKRKMWARLGAIVLSMSMICSGNAMNAYATEAGIMETEQQAEEILPENEQTSSDEGMTGEQVQSAEDTAADLSGDTDAGEEENQGETPSDITDYVAAEENISTEAGTEEMEEVEVTEEEETVDSSSTYSGTDGTISWKIAYGQLTITGSGECSGTPQWLEYADEITSVSVSISPTSIAGWFKDCVNLSYINNSYDFLKNVTDMSYAFYNCPNLSVSLILYPGITNYEECFTGAATADGESVHLSWICTDTDHVAQGIVEDLVSKGSESAEFYSEGLCHPKRRYYYMIEGSDTEYDSSDEVPCENNYYLVEECTSCGDKELGTERFKEHGDYSEKYYSLDGTEYSSYSSISCLAPYTEETICGYCGETSMCTKQKPHSYYSYYVPVDEEDTYYTSLSKIKCESDYYIVYKCSQCGAIYEDQREICHKDHGNSYYWKETYTTEDGTVYSYYYEVPCLSSYIREYTCQDCNQVITESGVRQHDFSASYDEEYPEDYSGISGQVNTLYWTCYCGASYTQQVIYEGDWNDATDLNQGAVHNVTAAYYVTEEGEVQSNFDLIPCNSIYHQTGMCSICGETVTVTKKKCHMVTGSGLYYTEDGEEYTAYCQVPCGEKYTYIDSCLYCDEQVTQSGVKEHEGYAYTYIGSNYWVEFDTSRTDGGAVYTTEDGTVYSDYDSVPCGSSYTKTLTCADCGEVIETTGIKEHTDGILQESGVYEYRKASYGNYNGTVVDNGSDSYTDAEGETYTDLFDAPACSKLTRTTTCANCGETFTTTVDTHFWANTKHGKVCSVCGITYDTCYQTSPIAFQPADTSIVSGEKFVFRTGTAATGVTYLWQYSTDGGKTWIDTTRTKDNYTTTGSEAMNGRMYRCMVTDENGYIFFTDAATLTVKPAIEITSQTDAQTVNVGELYKFRVTAVSNTGSKLTYLWQYSKTLKGWTDTTRTVNNYGTYATVGVDGKYFRCKITDEAGNVVYSTPAMVRVLSDITITAQPTDATVASGKRFYFTVTATGSSLTYLWQYSTDGGETWIDTTRARNNYTTYAKKGMDGRMFRCVITDSSNNTVISEAGTLTVK